ncbi:hypothetical protein [Sphingomonas sp. TZW2008]|uniref:hypothetical protein n=1 Tax=Sphingomonas sp. TZW2008 TaxID=1917973 RepID=UPI000A272730|nr:hypothetical protein [Sphingomonas sp. TZW2008]
MTDDRTTYPDTPGWKGVFDTGRDAAAAMAPKLGRLQRLVRELVAARGPQGLTPEEAANMSGQDRVSLQPRFSELKAKGAIVDSGMRRQNPSSRKRAVVWVLPAFGPTREEER